jgi:hypothetical protein
MKYNKKVAFFVNVFTVLVVSAIVVQYLWPIQSPLSYRRSERHVMKSSHPMKEAEIEIGMLSPAEVVLRKHGFTLVRLVPVTVGVTNTQKTDTKKGS